MMREPNREARFIGRFTPFFERTGIPPFVWRSATYAATIVVLYYFAHAVSTSSQPTIVWSPLPVVIAYAAGTGLLAACVAEMLGLPFGFRRTPAPERLRVAAPGAVFLLGFELLNHQALMLANPWLAVAMMVAAFGFAALIVSTKRTTV